MTPGSGPKTAHTLRVYRGGFPHHFRTFSAHSPQVLRYNKRKRCGEGAVMVRKTGGVSTDILQMVCKWSGSDQSSIKKRSKNNNSKKKRSFFRI